MVRIDALFLDEDKTIGEEDQNAQKKAGLASEKVLWEKFREATAKAGLWSDKMWDNQVICKSRASIGATF